MEVLRREQDSEGARAVKVARRLRPNARMQATCHASATPGRARQRGEKTLREPPSVRLSMWGGGTYGRVPAARRRGACYRADHLAGDVTHPWTARPPNATPWSSLPLLSSEHWGSPARAAVRVAGADLVRCIPLFAGTQDPRHSRPGQAAIAQVYSVAAGALPLSVSGICGRCR